MLSWNSILRWSLECRDAAGTGWCPLSWDPKATLGGCFSSTERWINCKAPNTKWEIFLHMRKTLLCHKLSCLEQICVINHDGSMSSCGLHAILASGILVLNILPLFPLCFYLSSCVWDIKVASFCPVASLSKTQFVWSFCWVSSKSVCLVWRFWTHCFGPPGIMLNWFPAQHLVGTWDEKCNKILVPFQTEILLISGQAWSSALVCFGSVSVCPVNISCAALILW